MGKRKIMGGIANYREEIEPTNTNGVIGAENFGEAISLNTNKFLT